MLNTSHGCHGTFIHRTCQPAKQKLYSLHSISLILFHILFPANLHSLSVSMDLTTLDTLYIWNHTATCPSVLGLLTRHHVKGHSLCGLQQNFIPSWASPIGSWWMVLHSSANGPLGCIHLLAVLRNATANTAGKSSESLACSTVPSETVKKKKKEQRLKEFFHTSNSGKH